MEKFKKILKREMDVDYLACVHGMSMVFIYGLELYLIGIKDISYVVIFQMFVAGYLIAWTQKLLFIKERIYGRKEFWVRSVLWCLLPNVWCFLGGRFFHWYEGTRGWVEPVFYLFMICYYIMVHWSFQTFYREETKELNELLQNYQHKSRGKES